MTISWAPSSAAILAPVPCVSILLNCHAQSRLRSAKAAIDQAHRSNSSSISSSERPFNSGTKKTTNRKAQIEMLAKMKPTGCQLNRTRDAPFAPRFAPGVLSRYGTE